MLSFLRLGFPFKGNRRVCAALLLVVACRPILPAGAQQAGGTEAGGYVTALRLPSGFDVDREHVVVTPETDFSLDSDRKKDAHRPHIGDLRIGMYVQVSGVMNYKLRTIVANTVTLRDEWNRKVSGFGVIVKVVSAGATPVFRADGYDVRIAGSADLSFAGDYKTLADVGTNDWVRFEGKRDRTGVLVATKAAFSPGKPTHFKAAAGIEVPMVKTRPAGAGAAGGETSTAGTIDSSEDGTGLAQDEEVKIGPLSKWHTLPADQPLQERVHRIGMSLVPAYQRDLPDDDPSKIHFRFYAADYPHTRADICLLDGVILVPKQVVERVENDDEVAAVLADGVAYNLQRQAARAVKALRKQLGVLAAEAVVSAFVPMPLVGYPTKDTVDLMEQERGRLALALMADAGYDPWKAPQAWRILGPRKLPKDLSTLDYPDRSVYQLNVLRVQYPRPDVTISVAAEK